MLDEQKDQIASAAKSTSREWVRKLQQVNNFLPSIGITAQAAEKAWERFSESVDKRFHSSAQSLFKKIFVENTLRLTG